MATFTSTIGMTVCPLLFAGAVNARQSSTSSNSCVRPAADLYEPDIGTETTRRSFGMPLESTPAVPPNDDSARPRPPAEPVSEPGPRLELSFGSAEKFYNQDLYDPGGFVTRKAIPVSTIRPVIDWLFQPRASVWLAFDLPLEPRSDLKGSGDEEVVVLTYVPPALQTGTRFTFLEVNLLRDIWLDLQVDGGLGWVFSSKEEVRLFPHLGWRLHLRDNSGFTAYAGVSYEFRVSVGALVYGVGHHF